MRIALVNVVGTEGSTGKIVSKLIANYTSKGNDCKAFYGRGEALNDGVYFKHGNKMDTIIHYGLARITDKEGYYSTIYTRHIIKDIKEFAPDRIIIINLHGHWLNIPLFLNEISKMDVNISWIIADEFPYTARCEYTNGCEKYKSNCEGCTKYKNSYKQFKVKQEYYKTIIPMTVFTSAPFIVNNAKQSSLLKGAKFKAVNTGIDVDFYYPVETNKLRNELGIENNKIILLNVAPYSNKRKGVEFFLKAAKAMERDNRFVFINVGYDGHEKIIPSNFITIPYVSNQEELREYYSLADKFVCTSIQDALPNACAEAMSCGTPLIAFNISGMPYLADYPTLELVDSVSTESLVKKILETRKKDGEIIERTRKEAIENYAFSKYADSILNDFSESTT